MLKVILGVFVAFPAVCWDDKDDVKGAVKKIGDNYSYTLTTKSEGDQGGGGGGGGRQRPQMGPVEGKVAEGYTYITSKLGDNSIEAVLKSGKVAIKTKDGWKSGDELGGGGGGGGGGGQGMRGDPSAFIARRLQNQKPLADETASIIDKVKELKKGDDCYSGDLTDDGAKELLSPQRGGGGGGGGGNRGPQISDAKGSVKFWVKDGVLVKYELNLQGKMAGRNNQEIAINRTTTVEVKDVGSTKNDVPEDAKKKLTD